MKHIIDENSIAFFILLALFSIAFEVFIAYMMRFKKKKEILAVLLTSIITKPTLCLLLCACTLGIFPIKDFAALIFFIFTEIAIIIIEWKLLAYALKDPPSELLFLSIRLNLYTLLSWPFLLMLINRLYSQPEPYSMPIPPPTLK